MKPDEIVETLNTEWDLPFTRRSVLTYEKGENISPPYLETGKLKEYPQTVIAELIASWCLIHGEFGVKPQKVKEIRKRALQILYKYQDVWRMEIPNAKQLESLHELVQQGVSYQKAGDFFVYSWIKVKMAVTFGDAELKNQIKLFIKSGDFDDIPPFDVIVDYNVSRDRTTHVGGGIRTENVMGKGLISINFTDTESLFLTPADVADMMDVGGIAETGYQGQIHINYFHPEDYVSTRPIIK